MEYLIDYENVAQNGLDGLSELKETDSVILFYSAKNNGINIALTQIIKDLKAEYTLMYSEKVSHNYMDFWIVCECSRLFFKENKENISIISNDKGYISVKDYFIRLGKTIHLYSSIRDSLKSEISKEENNTLTETEGMDNGFVPKNLNQEQTVFLNKVLSPTDKDSVRELLKDFPKKNGELHQKVYLAIEEEKKLGNYHFRLSSDFPNALLGSKIFDATKDFFCEFHNIRAKEKSTNNNYSKKSKSKKKR